MPDGLSVSFSVEATNNQNSPDHTDINQAGGSDDESENMQATMNNITQNHADNQNNEIVQDNEKNIMIMSYDDGDEKAESGPYE